MYKIRILLLSMLLFTLILAPRIGRADETDIFIYQQTQPDALILLDLSGSMQNVPAGCSEIFNPLPGQCFQCFWYFVGTNCFSDSTNTGYYPYHPYDPNGDYEPCDVSAWSNKPKYSTADCSGPYYIAPVGQYTTDCSKVEIAKRAIKKILDANKNGTVDPNPASPPGAISPDQTALGIRLGYMNMYNSQGNDSGINVVNTINSDYSVMWDNIYNPPNPAVMVVAGKKETAYGGTPLAAALTVAKTTLDSSKAADPAKSCRQKFVILITDGQDTWACSGSGSDCQNDMYKRRKQTLKSVKALADAGYKVFVIGFGVQMPQTQIYTLNWMAYYGGTDNSLQANSGNTSAITPTSGNPCTEGQINDPGLAALSGYAYWALDEVSLVQDLQDVVKTIGTIQGKYSFSVPSIAAGRISDQNFLYQASFVPTSNDPFWRGYLRKYPIDATGDLGSSTLDAGDKLSQADPSSRNIFTYISGIQTDFKDVAPGLVKNYLGVGTGSQASTIISYVRGESANNPEGWKLGDIFHSNPIIIGAPSSYYSDSRSLSAFNTFRTNNKNRTRITVAGANDGQFHAFGTDSMNEKWSFIPPNLLPKLQYVVHTTLPPSPPESHTYFVDGPVTAADVWLGSGDGTNKNPNDWKTLLVFSEGRGVRDYTDATSKYLWSSSPYCDQNFNGTYMGTGNSTYPYYCGYWAFDVTNTDAATPAFKWLLNPTSQQAPYLAEPWSKMPIGRVKISGNERWVGFIGGGYTNDGDSNRGKGFFVVDLNSGNILWSFTRGDDANMTYSLPASPAVVDTDNDGFVDTAYIGDLGGNIWRFKFCTKDDDNTCGTGNWTGGRLFQSSSATPIYITPAVGRDSGGSLWVFWGTGDEQNPNAYGTSNLFGGVKDNRTSTFTFGQLVDISNSIFNTGPGWYINLPSGEKVLTDPAVFAGVIAWTTYSPTQNSDPCMPGGTARLYALAMMPLAVGGVTFQPGAGLFSNTSAGTDAASRSVVIGSGIPQTPVFSQKPAGATGGTDLYVGISGGAGKDTSIFTAHILPDGSPLKSLLQTTGPSAQLIHWWDQRVQP